jgi:hypothetical protein
VLERERERQCSLKLASFISAQGQMRDVMTEIDAVIEPPARLAEFRNSDGDYIIRSYM